MRLWRARSAQVQDRPGAGVEECGAYLSGTYAELLVRRGTPVPAWAWINRLAHADEPAVRDGIAAEGDDGPWPAARRCLEAVALDVAAGVEAGLPELQREVLRPLELLLLDADAALDLTAPGLTSLVLRALSRRPGTRRA